MKLIALLMMGIVALTGLRTGKSDNNSIAVTALANTAPIQSVTPPACDLNICRSQAGIPKSVKNAWFRAARSDDASLLREIHADYPDILNIQDFEGDTAVHLATLFQKCEAMAVLIDLGANTSIPNKRYITAAHGQGEGIRNDIAYTVVRNTRVLYPTTQILKNRHVCPHN